MSDIVPVAPRSELSEPDPGWIFRAHCEREKEALADRIAALEDGLAWIEKAESVSTIRRYVAWLLGRGPRVVGEE